MRGDDVVFNIEVFNQGNIDATNIEVTDYIPNGLTLNDNAWTLAGNKATRVVSSVPQGQSQSLTITFTIDDDAPSSVTNLAEISGDDADQEDCDSTPDNRPNNDGTPQNDQIGGGCNPGGDEDDHDPETITLVDGVFDLALRKTTITEGPFAIGDDVTFNIRVRNQGNIDATNIEVTDYIPTGLTLNDSAWTQSGNNATRVIPTVLSNTNQDITITFTINSDATGRISNFAEISEDNADDCDSVADGENGNQDGETAQNGMLNNNIGDGCNPGGDEDDHDIQSINVELPNPSILLEKIDANSDFDQDGSIGGNDSQTVNTGDEAVFKIIVTNNGDEALTSITLTDTIAPNCAGSVTLPNTVPTTFMGFVVNGSSTGSASNNVLEPGESFEYTCKKDDSQSDYTNEATVNAKGITSDDSVNSKDTTEVVVVDTVYDLALRKTIASNGPYSIGDTVTFTIEVFNQGTLPASNIEVTDYIPTGLTLTDSSWTNAGTTATKLVSSIAA